MKDTNSLHRKLKFVHSWYKLIGFLFNSENSCKTIYYELTNYCIMIAFGEIKFLCVFISPGVENLNLRTKIDNYSKPLKQFIQKKFTRKTPIVCIVN